MCRITGIRTGRSHCGQLPKQLLKQCLFDQKDQKFHDVFIANQDFAELKGKKLSYQELSKYPILMLDKHSTTSEYLHRLFQQHQLDLVPEIELTSNDLLIDLARIGLGIAFIPNFCLSEQTCDLFAVQTEEELPERELVIAYNEQVLTSKAAKEFLSFLTDVQLRTFPESPYFLFQIFHTSQLILLPLSRKHFPVSHFPKPVIQQQDHTSVTFRSDHPPGRLQNFVHSRIQIRIVKPIHIGSIKILL